MINDYFLQLVVVLFSARFLGECAARVKVPAVIGELLAGVILGPSLLGIIPLSESLTLLSEIGIVLLLFEVGMETSFPRLIASGTQAISVAVVGVLAPFVLGFWLSYYVFHLALLPSLFLASTLTATSIGITMRVLSELHRQFRRESQIVLGAAIFDDIIGIVFLAVLYEFAVSGQVNSISALRILGLMLIFLVLTPPLVKGISFLIRKYESKSEIPGLLPSLIVALILLFSSLAHLFGAPYLLGGFAAGLAFSPQFALPLKGMHAAPQFSQHVAKEMKPIIHLFTPIFFVHVGLLLNLREVAWNSLFVWMLSLALLLAAIVGKLMSGWVLWSEKRQIRSIVGISMIPRGEVGLIFAGVGRDKGVLSDELYAALIIVIAMTTIMAPCIMRLYYHKNARFFDKEGEGSFETH